MQRSGDDDSPDLALPERAGEALSVDARSLEVGARAIDLGSAALTHRRSFVLDWSAKIACPWTPRRAASQLTVGGASSDVGGEDRGEAAGGGHCSGTPALRMPSKMGSSWAGYVGSSLAADQLARLREMVKSD